MTEELHTVCAQRRFRSAWAFAQSDQNLHWTYFGLVFKEANFPHANNGDFGQTAQSDTSLGAHVVSKTGSAIVCVKVKTKKKTKKKKKKTVVKCFLSCL